MSRSSFILAFGMITFGLLQPPSEIVAITLASYSFESGGEGWQIYDYNGGISGGGGVYYPVSWEASGGIDASGYVWGDDSRWRIDTPESPHSILPFLIYCPTVDLRNAALSVYLRGDNLDLKGGSVYFWVLNNDDQGGRWHYIAQSLQISNDTWGKKQNITLTNDEGLWHNSWQRTPSDPASLDHVLSGCHSYGFSFVGFSEEVTGRFSMDEFVLSISEPSLLAFLTSGGICVWVCLCLRQYTHRLTVVRLWRAITQRELAK